MEKICKTCGCVINEDEEFAFVVNEGTPDEYVQCEMCHESDWEDGKITMCESCGRWFDDVKLKTEYRNEKFAFTPCPHCGNDVVEGYSFDEMTREYGRTLSDDIMCTLRERLTGDSTNTSRDDEINAMSGYDILREWLAMNSIFGSFAKPILRVVESAFGIDLNI